jgi:hypothetical protein
LDSIPTRIGTKAKGPFASGGRLIGGWGPCFPSPPRPPNWETGGFFPGWTLSDILSLNFGLRPFQLAPPMSIHPFSGPTLLLPDIRENFRHRKSASIAPQTYILQTSMVREVALAEYKPAVYPAGPEPTMITLRTSTPISSPGTRHPFNIESRQTSDIKWKIIIYQSSVY